MEDDWNTVSVTNEEKGQQIEIEFDEPEEVLKVEVQEEEPKEEVKEETKEAPELEGIETKGAEHEQYTQKPLTKEIKIEF